ncbi:MFS transporter [Luteimicrobium album]|uniref:MFS transporter n=1 Tax=Luteimicrobium album TaxID=1054550 RepID=UPI0024E07A1B|nr:MFS transporter [Luteimicrobium album]
MIEANVPHGRALVPVLVFVGVLVAVVSSLGAPLIPTIGTDYGVSFGTAQWSLTITVLVGAVISPVVGRFGDGPHRKRMLLVGLGVVVVGSALAALPTTIFTLLLIGRGLQGVGLALMPLAMGVARDHLPVERSRSALATLSVTTVVGVGLGYPITGVIAEYLSFRVGFWMAAGLGALAMVAVALVVPKSTHRLSQRFDLAGAALLAPALTGVLLVISEGETWGWGSWPLWTVLAVSLVIFAIWIWHELRTSAPLVNLRLLRDRIVLTTNATGMVAGIGMYIQTSLIVRYIQTPTSISYGLGATVIVSGLALVPMSALSFFSSRLTTRLGQRINPGRLLPFGVLALAASLVMTAFARGSLWEIFVIMGISGIGTGCAFAVMPRMIVGAVPADETSSALATNQVLRTIGYSIGSALAAAILTAHTAAGATFPADDGYTVGSLVGVVLCVVAALLSWLLPTRRSQPLVLSADQQLEVEEDVDAAISGTIALDEGLENADTHERDIR